jgi:hypothetical protein
MILQFLHRGEGLHAFFISHPFLGLLLTSWQWQYGMIIAMAEARFHVLDPRCGSLRDMVARRGSCVPAYRET